MVRSNSDIPSYCASQCRKKTLKITRNIVINTYRIQKPTTRRRWVANT